MNKTDRHIDTENRLMVARGARFRGLGERGEGIEKYRLVVTKLVVMGK